METIGLTFLGILLLLTSVFMMLLILVQRGKGGGLTGALGGMGGQSAFGSKAGDVFTRITVFTAIIWITLCMLTIAVYNPPPRNTLDAKRKETSAISSTDEETTADAMSGMDGGDSTGSDDSESAPGDVDKELEALVEDDIDAPADAEVDNGADDTEAEEDATDQDSGPSLENQGDSQDAETAEEESDNGNN